MKSKILGVAVLAILLPLPLLGQQVGATVTGHIYDPSGAAVAGATVTAKQVNTGAVYTAASNATGLYQLPFMNTGPYTITVERQGFKALVRSGITLEVAQKAVMDFTLEVGAVSQQITVSANATRVQAESGEQTWTLNSTLMTQLPLRGENFTEAVRYAAGVTMVGSSRSLTPFDTSGSQQLDIGGGLSAQGGGNGREGQSGCCGNVYLIDGVVISDTGGGVPNLPISDSVQEVNVQNTMYDAEYGWSTGGAINAISKGGTNQIHGDAYEFFQDTPLNANYWNNNRSHIPIAPWHFNVYGLSVGAPIKKDKLFAFFDWQEVKRDQPDPFTDSVPTAAMKQGDFSGVLNSSGQVQTIYDPLTTTLTSPYTRTAFSGNIIPANRQSAVAQKVLAYIPLGNVSGAQYTQLGNLVNTSNSRKFLDNLPEFGGRADYNLSDKTHAFFRYYWNQLSETRGYAYSTLSGYNLAETSGNSPFSRAEDDFAFQVTHTFNPTTVLEARVGMSRFLSGGGSTITNGLNLANLGFSSTFVSQALPHFPVFSWSNYQGAGASIESITVQPTYSANAVLAKQLNRHSLKFGFQMMDLMNLSNSPGNASGNFSFTGIYTTANPLALSAATGNSIADFLLGYPASGNIQVQEEPARMSHFYSLFAQDDVHVSRKLTLTAGLRWDYQGPLTDRYNALANGYCATCASPLQIPGMNLQGGLEFAGVGGNPRGTPNQHYSNFGPRLSFAYAVRPNTVIRGGYGMIYAAAWDDPGVPAGFSQTTSLVSSIQTGIPNPNISLVNPFPTGVLHPVGSADGLATGLGQSITFPDPAMNMPRVQQYSLNIQHQFSRNWLASAAYVGSYISRLPVNRNLNYLSLQDLGLAGSTAYYPSAATVSALTSSVTPNPFLQASSVTADAPILPLLAGTFLTSSSVQAQQLLVPYPQFNINGVTEDYVPVGKSKYNGLTLDLNKRMSHGLDFDANFTWSKTMQAMAYLNPTDPTPAWTISYYDVPAQFKLSAYWQLPFGPGMRFAPHANSIVSRVIGGWYTSFMFDWMDGFPTPFPTGVAPTGNPMGIPNQSVNQWFNPCTLNTNGTTSHCTGSEKPAWAILQPDQLETYSPYISQLRQPEIGDLEINFGKSTRINERFTFKFYADFQNATNTTQWFQSGPNLAATSGTFGAYANYTGQSNYPRVIELVGRLEF